MGQQDINLLGTLDDKTIELMQWVHRFMVKSRLNRLSQAHAVDQASPNVQTSPEPLGILARKEPREVCKHAGTVLAIPAALAIGRRVEEAPVTHERQTPWDGHEMWEGWGIQDEPATAH